jgi:hypothetical protein
MYINTVTQEGSVTFLILQSRTVNDAWFINYYVTYDPNINYYVTYDPNFNYYVT